MNPNQVFDPNEFKLKLIQSGFSIWIIPTLDKFESKN